METPKANPDASKSSNIIIITPDELLKLGLFKDIGTSAVNPIRQVTDSSVASLKQQIRNKLKAATDGAHNIVQETSKPNIKHKKCKSHHELLKEKSDVSKYKIRANNNTSCATVAKKEKLRSMNKYPPMVVPSSTNECWNKPKSRYKINKSTVVNSTVTSPDMNIPDLVNPPLKCEVDKSTVAQRKIETGKPVIPNSSPKTSALESSNTLPEVATNLTMNISESNIVDIVKKPSNIPYDNYQCENSIVDRENVLENGGSLVTNPVSVSEEILDSQRNTNTENKSNKEYHSFKTVILKKAEKVDPTVSEVGSNLKIFDNHNKNVKGSCLNKFENASILDSVIEPKKEVNVISDTPVCFSSEELKHLVSKAIYNTQNTCFKKTHAAEDSERQNLQNIKIDSPKNHMKSTCLFKEIKKIPNQIISKDIIFQENSGKLERKQISRQFSDQLNKYNTPSSSSRITNITNTNIKDTEIVKLTNKEEKCEEKVPTPGNDMQIAKEGSETEIVEGISEIETENMVQHKLVENKVCEAADKKGNGVEENQPIDDEGRMYETPHFHCGSIIVHYKRYTHKAHQELSVKDIKRKQETQPENKIGSNKERKCVTDDQNTSDAVNPKMIDNSDRKLDCSKMHDTSIDVIKDTSKTRSRRKTLKTRNEGSKPRDDTYSTGDNIKLILPLKTYSRKSTQDTVNKEKTAVETDTQLKSKDFPKKESEQLSANEHDTPKSEEKTKDIPMENNVQVKTTEKHNLSITSSLHKKRGRKRRLIVLDSMPTFKEDDSTENKSKIKESTTDVKNKGKLTHEPCASSLQENYESDDKHYIVNHENENIKKDDTIINKPDIEASKKEYKTAVDSKKKPHVTSSQDSQQSELPGCSCIVQEAQASDEVPVNRTDTSKTVNIRRNEENLRSVLTSSDTRENKGSFKNTEEEELSNDSILTEKRIVKNSVEGNSSQNLGTAMLEENLEDNLKVTSLQTSLENILTTSSSNNAVEAEIPVEKIPGKRGKPWKNVNVEVLQQKIECALSSAANGTSDNKIREIRSIESKDENSTEGSSKDSLSTAEYQKKDLDITPLQKPLKNALASSITSDDVKAEFPVAEIPRKRGNPKKEMRETFESTLPSIPNEANGNKIREMDCNDERNQIPLDDNLLKVTQSEDETDKNVHKKDIQDGDDLNITEHPKEDLNVTSLKTLFNETGTSSSLNNVIEAEIPIKEMPKKRGRPRKNTNMGEKQQNVDLSTPNIGELVTSTPVQKTRGRKRQTLTSSETNPEDLTDNLILDESLRGRKRKRINYFELENSTQIENDHDKKRKRKLFSASYKIPEESKVLMTESQKNENIFNIQQSSTFSSTSQNMDDVKEEFDIQKSSASSQEKNDAIDGDLEESDGIKVPDSESGGSTRKVKKSKYRHTGETIMMMHSIFSAAFKNKSDNKTEAEESDSKGIHPESRPRARIDRRRKSAKIITIVTDEDNKVMCMICNKKVDNEEWSEHNRNIHYNLSWREGEPEVNMDDTPFIQKTLRPMLQKDKVLKCNKCDKKCTSVSEYITHWERCVGIVSSNGIITCAVCKTEMEKSKWSSHKQSRHNNLAWRIGDRPLNLSDQNLVLSILNALYKAKKPLRCEKCGAVKKSVVGFLSHQAQCGSTVEDAKVKCELCDRKVLPVSMQSHIKLVHETPKETEELEEISSYSVTDLDFHSSKRKAARTAMLIIDKFSKNKIDQERNEHYIGQVDFTEENFIIQMLQKELANNQMIKCKFKDCKFETGVVKVLLEHMNSCENKPEQYYVCKKCLLICDNEDGIRKHMKVAHAIDVIEDDFKTEHEEESDEDIDDVAEIELYQKGLRKRKMFEKKRLETDINYKIKPSFLFTLVKRSMKLFSHAFDYTIKFCIQNFSETSLFDKLRNLNNDWILLNNEMIEEYLPQSEESCSVARRIVNGFENVLNSEYTFKKYELFESDCDEGNVTIFCGGPIYAMAWLPTPYTALNSRQVLAVASGKCFDEKFLVNENYSDASLIQFWDFGVLQNKNKISQPKLMFCLAIDFGPVWHMEWCPSGCYDIDIDKDEKKLSRLGLLAVAGSNSFVYVYSIPSLDENQMALIYKAKPVLKLQLEIKGEEVMKKHKFFATRISWSMTLGHRHVAVGYTNGTVGLFDVDTNSKLMKFKDDDVDVLLPYRIFQAHTYYISALSWVPLCGGNRWLMTASFDRNAYVWDLSNDTKISALRRNILTDGVWLPNWLSYVTSDDESSTNYYSIHACVQSYRDYMYEHVYLTLSSTTITSLSSSSWLNSLIQCSAGGEVIAMFPNQMLFCLNSEKKLKSLRYCLGYAKLIDKHKTPEERVAEEMIAKEAHKSIVNPARKRMPMSHLLYVNNAYHSKYEPVAYDEANEKYALLFCDMKMDKFSDLPNKPALVEELSSSKPNLYSMQKINKIAYNPNRQASLYYATGHQAGFVRVGYMKFLENDPQIA